MVDRELRKRTCPNYKEPSLSSIYIEGSRPPKQSRKVETVYPIRIVEEESESSSKKYKVHYIGYSKRFDEWKSEEEIFNIGEEDQDPEYPDSKFDGLIMERFSLHRELAFKIKMALNNNRKDSPVIRINMPFDQVEFNGGLRMCGVKKKCVRAIQYYSIRRYQDLNGILGINWHFRGLNGNGDFCYVLLNTVEFYLYHRRPLVEYIPKEAAQAPSQAVQQMGDALVFLFVRGDGTPDKFGTDKTIFVNNN